MATGTAWKPGAPFVPPTPPRTPKSAATRELLMRIAGEMFVEHGYDAVSLSRIVEAAGLTKGAFYGQFRSKGQLLVEVIRWRMAVRDHDPSFQEQLDRDDAAELMIDADGRAIRLLEVDAAAAARHDGDVAAGMAELYAQRDDAIRAAFTGSRDPATISAVIAALNVGIGAREAVGIAPPDAARFREVIVPMLEAVFGIAPTPPEVSRSRG